MSYEIKRRYPSNSNEPRSYSSDLFDDKDKRKKSFRINPWLWFVLTLILTLGLIIWGFQRMRDSEQKLLTKERSMADQKIKNLESELQKSQKVIQKLNERDSQSSKDSKKLTDQASIYVWKTLPSSDVWCQGDKRSNRICKIRNLCYHPKHKEWFISKTSRSIILGVPFNETEFSLLELNTVEGHTTFFWNYVEASPFQSSLQNVVMKYEEMPTFMFSRLHPRNIWHNIHDDIFGAFFLIKEYMGGGDEIRKMPFSLDHHRILFMDAYSGTDSTRPFQYLSNHPLRFKSYLDEDKDTITCFRDAIMGNTKVATFYQYGFTVPQSPIANKTLNGMLVRQVSEWFVRRLGLKVGFDEDLYHQPPSVSRDEVFGTNLSKFDLKDTDIIVIMARGANRLILNEQEMVQALSKKFGLSVVIVRNEDHSFEEQIKYLRRARVVLGMHGSILVMTMFCRRGTVVIEMYPFGVPSEHYTPYKTLAGLPGMGLIYRAWENKYEEASIGHPKNHELSGGIAHLPQEEQAKILATKSVPQHLCCTSHFWLYRIYQDTRVNIPEVESLIEEALEESRQTILSKLYTKNWDEPSFLKPPSVHSADCVEGKLRAPGELWASWNQSWTGAEVQKWNVYIMNTQQEYVTKSDKPAIAVTGFQPNETVKFLIRPLAKNYKGSWGSVSECKV